MNSLFKHIDAKRSELYLLILRLVSGDRDGVNWLQVDTSLILLFVAKIIFFIFLFNSILTRNNVPLLTIKTSDGNRYTLVLNKNCTLTKQELSFLVRLLETRGEFDAVVYVAYFRWHFKLFWRFGVIFWDMWRYMWCFEAQKMAEGFGVTFGYADNVEKTFSNNLSRLRRAHRISILTEAALAAKDPWLFWPLRFLFILTVFILCFLTYFFIFQPFYVAFKYPIFYLFVVTRVCLGGWYAWLVLNYGSK